MLDLIRLCLKHRTDFDKMLTLKGNSAVYLMYAYARIRSIIRKVKENGGPSVEEVLASGVTISLEHPSEIALARELSRFGQTVESAIQELTPHKLCDLLFACSTAFSHVSNCL